MTRIDSRKAALTLLSDVMDLMDVMSRCDWTHNGMQDLEFPKTLSERKIKAWARYMKETFGPPLFVRSEKGRPLILSLPGKAMVLFFNKLAAEFVKVSRKLRTRVGLYKPMFDERFRDLFQAYGVMGVDLVRIAYVSVDIATKGSPADAPIDEAAAQYTRFFRLATDHTRLPDFDQAQNDYTLPTYQPGGRRWRNTMA
jgi:hypothetical protein